MMSELPRILIVEDSATDADLASREIRKGLGACVFEVVETRAAFLAALDTFRPDLVVSDYTLPDFDGLQALKLSLQHDPLLPVILVTGSLNEETAVHCIKSGATDYVLKDRITRLPFAVKEALEQKQTRLAKDAAEHALRESERFAHATVDALSAHLAILDATGEVLAVNHAWREFAAANSSTPVAVCEGSNYLTVCDTAHGPASTNAADMAAGIRAVMRGERSEFTLEYPCHSPAEQRWFIARVTRFAGEGAVRVVVAHENITERKRAEEALRESEEKYRAFFQSSLDAILLTTPDGGIQAANPAACRMLGRTEAEICALGRNGLVDTSDPRLAVLLRERAQTGSVFGELTMFRNDGSRFPIEMSSSLFQDRQGNLRSSLIVRDTTERKRAEEALRQSEELFRVVLTNILDPVFITDHDGQFTFICPNVTAILGYSVEDIQALGNILNLISDAPGSLADLEMHGEITNQERVIVDRYGQRRVFLMTVKRVLIGRGTRLYSFHDITERKRLDEQLRGKVAMLQALAEIDHEIMAATEAASVPELVCHRAAELVHAPKSALVTRTTAGDMELVTSYGLRDAVGARSEFAQAWQTGSMHIDNLKARGVIAVNEVITATSLMPVMFGAEGVRALVSVALAAGEEFLGALLVFDTTVRQWQADDLQVLNMLAGQAAIALEKLQLLQAVRGRALHLATLNEIGQAITSSLDLDRVLLTLLEKVRDATEAEACSVALIEPASGDLVFRQAVGSVAEAVIGLRLSPGQGLAGWVAQHRQSVIAPDVSADPRAYPLRSRSGFITRELIAVPLIAHDAVTGVIELVNKRRDRFSMDDRRLLESVAVQASIAIENARLFQTEHTGREALDTLYRIGQAVNSTLDADTILDRLTDEAMRAMHATHGSALVARPDRGCFERRSLSGYSPEQADKARTDVLPLDRGVNGRAYRTKQVVYVEDVQRDPDYHPLVPETHSELAVPILRGDQVIGNLDLQSPQVDAFRTVRLDFLQALTDQVAIALENARLFAETRRQMDEMSIVSQVALVGAAGQPFDEAVARATDALSRLWPTATIGFLYLDETGQFLQIGHVHHGPAALPTNITLSIDQGVTGWAVREQQPIRVGDVTTDPRYLAAVPDIRSLMVAPLVVGQRVIGAIDVGSPAVDAFSGDDLRVLTTLAGQLATIFEKARLDAELAGYVAQLERRVEERTVEIRRAQARTQAILDALGEGVVVTDVQGVIQYMNPAMEQVTGYNASECIGQNPRLWQSGQTPLEVYQAMWAAILAGQTWRGEIANRRKDGEFYYASLAAAPIPAEGDSQGPLAGLVGIQRDISERIRAETALRESEALYHSLVEVMPQNLCRKDLAGRFIFANRQFLAELNWSLADLIGKTDFDIHAPALAEKYRRDDQYVISTGQIIEVIEERAVSGGELRYVQTIKAPILNSAGNVIGVQITFWDVSDHIQAEEEMRRALEKEKELNKLKSNFVSLTSHEFRTPLTAILSSAELVEHYGDRWAPEKKLEHLRRIQTAVKHMTSLLDDILIIGKAEAGKLDFLPAPLDLLKFCRDLVEEIQLTDKANHALIFDGEVTCRQASMDQQLLRHILSNLLSNALKYSLPDGLVQFDLTCQAGQAIFRIQDHGLGIPPEDQARLFETFHRAGNVRNIQGTGLGLAIVKRSVDLHGGTLDVVSQVGVGTTFTVTLPLGLSSAT